MARALGSLGGSPTAQGEPPRSNKENQIKQCRTCGVFSESAKASVLCDGVNDHQFRPLSRKVLGRAFGSMGGRPRVYRTARERRAARLASYARANLKRRAKETAVI